MNELCPINITKHLEVVGYCYDCHSDNTVNKSTNHSRLVDVVDRGLRGIISFQKRTDFKCHHPKHPFLCHSEGTPVTSAPTSGAPMWSSLHSAPWNPLTLNEIQF
jgi:hypothetical protein